MICANWWFNKHFFLFRLTKKKMAKDDIGRKLKSMNFLYIITQCLFVRYRFSRQPLNRLLWNLTRVFDMVSERQLSILVSNGCIINDLSHKLCVGRSVTSDRYKKPKLRRWRQKHWTNWGAAGGERRVINSIVSSVFNGRVQRRLTDMDGPGWGYLKLLSREGGLKKVMLSCFKLCVLSLKIQIFHHFLTWLQH